MISRISKRVLAEQAGGGAKVWGEITSLAAGPNIVSDLGQGYPDFQGSKIALETAARTIQTGVKENQYSLIPGTPSLREKISEYYAQAYPGSRVLSADSEIVVTSSGTEALNSCVQALVDPGDEVVIFEPYFPWYVPCVRMAGGVCKIVTLEVPDFRIREQVLRKAISSKTKMIIFNSPHNPTGHVADREEVEMVASVAKENDLVVVSDEVYENFVFQGKEHYRLCDVDGMHERTVTIGSASKMFSLTGWRVGWVYGPADLVGAVRSCHAYNTYCAPTPLQQGVAAALTDYASSEEPARMAEQFRENVKLLADALCTIGVKPIVPEGGYFLVADVSGTDQKTDLEFCKWLAASKGVIGVPMSVFYLSNLAPSNLVRFAVCKKRETINTAVNATRA